MGTHEPAVRSAVRNHTSWMTAQAEAGGGGPRSHGSLRWIVSADGGGASLPFPDAVAGDDADAMLADCRERGQTGIGCWTSGLEPVGEIASVLVARGFEWGWSAHWGSTTSASSRACSAAAWAVRSPSPRWTRRAVRARRSPP